VVAMLEFYHRKKISLEQIVQKMCHNPAILFRIEKRGFIREGYFADLTLVNLNKPWTVNKENILAKCGWSPFEGERFQSSIEKTWISGRLAYDQGKIIEGECGMRLSFDRK
jgi:dihydroorotase